MTKRDDMFAHLGRRNKDLKLGLSISDLAMLAYIYEEFETGKIILERTKNGICRNQ